MYKQKRIDAGLTVQQISTESGIERSKLSRMENGRRSWAIWELEAYSSALKKLAKEMVKND
jgi:transcriptional regulator with XRE-family HTH domain